MKFMMPEIVLIENERGCLLQVNSLGPVYAGRAERFMRQAMSAPARKCEDIPYTLEPDSREAWEEACEKALSAIDEGRVSKVVLSRRKKLKAQHPFSSKDLLV
ncbi:MAG: isochorismate synthase, partial [Eggerthellaceae bacterium]|nr:isochorismate synthase [Eggerthellaceae bacterium]